MFDITSLKLNCVSWIHVNTQIVHVTFRGPAVKAKLVKYFQLRKQAKELKVQD